VSMQLAETQYGEHLDGLRKKIDAFDEALVRLLNARAACALEIGRVKGQLGLALYEPEREGAVLGNVRRANPGPLDDEAIRRLFERVVDEARRLERNAEAAVNPPSAHV
jgi:chorismate mutase